MEKTIEEIEVFRNGIIMMKGTLKLLASTIRYKKDTLKDKQRKGEESWEDYHDIYTNKYKFRHLHIAYCEKRGRTRLEIEPKVHPDNLPNEETIQRYKDDFFPEV